MPPIHRIRQKYGRHDFHERRHTKLINVPCYERYNIRRQPGNRLSRGCRSYKFNIFLRHTLLTMNLIQSIKILIQFEQFIAPQT